VRDKLSVFYYPEFVFDKTTLIKAILLFDEIHLMDRPSLTFGDKGQFGTIGAESPLHAYVDAFQKEGLPFYVHGARGFK
jgi:hypothetical protein